MKKNTVNAKKGGSKIESAALPMDILWLEAKAPMVTLMDQITTTTIEMAIAKSTTAVSPAKPAAATAASGMSQSTALDPTA